MTTAIVRTVLTNQVCSHPTIPFWLVMYQFHILGTGACRNSTFFCPNIGHVGASISATRVSDGLCGPSIPFFLPGPPSSTTEPECCDGSDEPLGVCPNICEQVGIQYRALLEQEDKLRKAVRSFSSFLVTFSLGTYLGFENPRIVHIFCPEGKVPS